MGYTGLEWAVVLASNPGSHPAFRRLQYGKAQATKSWMRAWVRGYCGIVHKDVGGHRELHMPPVMAHHSLFYFGPLLVLVVAHSDLAFMTAKCCQDWCSYHMYTSLFPVHVHNVIGLYSETCLHPCLAVWCTEMEWNGGSYTPPVACGKSVEAGTG